ncbi:hypothetical protein V6N13_012785, partial [Hibiscus sabdariffa]
NRERDQVSTSSSHPSSFCDVLGECGTHEDTNVVHMVTPEFTSTNSPVVGDDSATGGTFHDVESRSRVHRSSVNADAQTPTMIVETEQTSSSIPEMVEDGIHSQGVPEIEFLAGHLATEAHEGGRAIESPLVRSNHTELGVSLGGASITSSISAMVPVTAQNRHYMLTRISAENNASPASSPRGFPMPGHNHDAIGNTDDEEGAPSRGPVGPGDVVEGPIGNEGNSPVAQPPSSCATTRGVFSAAGGGISLVVVWLLGLLKI